jgi:hypothetical protein|tara:strand:+ start:2851 stop:3111 length:261 start_codon:yes stop_codon:yes gene_type:complete
MSKGRIKRGSVTTKKFKVGSQASITANTKDDYDKINFRDKAIDSFNNTTARKGSPAGKRRKASTPFSNISGLGGFGRIPQLNYKKK